jgi:hypothetical protein
MGDRVYVLPIVSTTIGTAVADIFTLSATSSKGIVLHQIHLTANVSAEAALRIRLKRSSAAITNGTGGAAGAPIPADPADAAVSITSRVGDITTQATGTFLTVWEDYWDTALPFDFMPAPEDRPTSLVSGGFVLDLPAVIVSTIIAGYVAFAEKP